jgi:hypothetical protein
MAARIEELGGEGWTDVDVFRFCPIPHFLRFGQEGGEGGKFCVVVATQILAFASL